MRDTIVLIQGLQFQWEPFTPPVLDIADLTVEKGSRVFIRGPSGSGKTTLLNLLSGILSPSVGTIEVVGTNLGTLNGANRDAFRADHIGFVFQMFNLIPYLTLVENVVLPCRFSLARRQRVERIGATLPDEAKRLLSRLQINPKDLKKHSVTQLSVGQQQRVAVARALIGRPEIIICDEPTSSLDADARQSFLDLLFQEVAEAGSTLIFVSHDSGLTEGFDRTINLPDINRAMS